MESILDREPEIPNPPSYPFPKGCYPRTMPDKGKQNSMVLLAEALVPNKGKAGESPGLGHTTWKLPFLRLLLSEVPPGKVNL